MEADRTTDEFVRWLAGMKSLSQGRVQIKVPVLATVLRDSDHLSHCVIRRRLANFLLLHQEHKQRILKYIKKKLEYNIFWEDITY